LPFRCRSRETLQFPRTASQRPWLFALWAFRMHRWRLSIPDNVFHSVSGRNASPAAERSPGFVFQGCVSPRVKTPAEVNLPGSQQPRLNQGVQHRGCCPNNVAQKWQKFGSTVAGRSQLCGRPSAPVFLIEPRALASRMAAVEHWLVGTAQ